MATTTPVYQKYSNLQPTTVLLSEIEKTPYPLAERVKDGLESIQNIFLFAFFRGLGNFVDTGVCTYRYFSGRLMDLSKNKNLILLNDQTVNVVRQKGLISADERGQKLTRNLEHLFQLASNPGIKISKIPIRIYIDVSPKSSCCRNKVLEMTPAVILPLSTMTKNTNEVRDYLAAQAVAEKQVRSHVIHLVHHWFFTALNCGLLTLAIRRTISIRQALPISVGLNLACAFFDRWNERRTTRSANRLALTYLNTATGMIAHLRHNLCANMAVKQGTFEEYSALYQNPKQRKYEKLKADITPHGNYRSCIHDSFTDQLKFALSLQPTQT